MSKQVIDEDFAKLRNKEFNKFFRQNYHRYIEQLPANKKNAMRDALKDAFYLGFKVMYRETE